MATIPPDPVDAKAVLPAWAALRRMPAGAAGELVVAALGRTRNPVDRSVLLEAAGLLLADGGVQGRRFGIGALWPHRVDLRAQRSALCAAVLTHWRSAPSAAREAVLGLEAGVLDEVLAGVIAREPGAATAWLAEHPGRASVERLAELVRCADREASSAAAGMLAGRTIAALGLGDASVVGERLAGLSAGWPTDGSGLEALVERVGELAACFEEHQQRDIMTVGLLLAEGPGRIGGGSLSLLGAMMEEEHAATTGMRAALRRGKAPFVRGRAWRWLAGASVRVAALDRLSRAGSAAEHEAVLGEGYLVLRPVRAGALRMIKVKGKGGEAAAGEALPTGGVRDRLTPTARRWLVDFAGLVRAPDGVCGGLRERGLTDGSAWVRWAHLRTASPGEAADYALDADGRVARSAALARSPAGGVSWTRWPPRGADGVRMRLTERLTRSPHAAVRAVARGDARRLNPWLVDRPESRLAAREWLRADRAGFTAAVRMRMSGGDASERVNAIRLVRLLRLGLSLEPALIDIASGGDARSAATAVAALGDLSTPTARACVRSAVEAADERVRANAVEASLRPAAGAGDIADADGGLYGLLFELKGDGHHRVRANALRGLIEGSGTGVGGRVLDESGVDGLSAMLEDEREMHRLAGLWLAERTLAAGGRRRLGSSWDGLCRRVAAMAVRDEGEAVRARALRCAKRLLAEVRGARGEG